MFMSRTSGMFTLIPSANRIVEFQSYLNGNKTEVLRPKCKRERSHPHAISRNPGYEKKKEIPIAQCINLVNPLIGLSSRDFETHSPLVMRCEVLFKPRSTLQTIAIFLLQRATSFPLSPNQCLTNCSPWSKSSQLPGFCFMALELRVPFTYLFLTQRF